MVKKTALLFLLIILIIFSTNVRAEIQGDQIKLFSTTVTADSSSASARPWHNGGDLPADWLTPVDWTTGPVYWKVQVLNKKTSQKFRLELHFEREHPDGTVGAEEIAEAANPIEVANTGDTVYMKLNPLSQWSLYSTWIPSWQWNKPINGIYIILYAWDDVQNKWVWFADNTVCAGYGFCYKGTLKQTDHLPITISTDAYVVKQGGTFVPPSTWSGCPWTECANIPQIQPSVSATTAPGTGQCSKKSQGDANCDGTIGIIDFEYWRREYRKELTTTTADFNGDGVVTMADYEIWRRSYLSKP